MSTEEINEAERLRAEGYSIREIAGLMGIDKGKIERRTSTPLRARNIVDDLPDIPATDKGLSSEVHMKALELDHERKMTDFDLRKEEMAIKRQELKTQEVQAQAKVLELQIAEKELDREQEKENARIIARGEVLVSKLNRLVQELLDSCRKATWQGEDVNEYLVRLDSLKEKVLKFCERNGIDEEELHIWQSINALSVFWEKAKEDLTGWFSDDVELNATKKEQAMFRSWLVSEFDDLGVAVESDEVDSEDENEEDEEDEDDEM
ncbi:MAG: hypothetical protein JWP57_4312 [Spirosoma sp.]|nr:hypothetical protein [Spirosoma sp.]